MGSALLTKHLKKYRGYVKTGLHVGANVGQERNTWQSVGASRVIWVEANPEMMPELQQNILQYPEQFAHWALLGDQEKANVPFHVFSGGGPNRTGGTGPSSMLDKVDDESTWNFTESKTLHMPMTRADTLLQKLQIRMGMLNTAVIDVQGAELQVLKGFGDYLRHLQFVVVEYIVPETYQDASSLTDVTLFMLDHGFHLWSKQARRPEAGDLLFVRGVPIRR